MRNPVEISIGIIELEGLVSVHRHKDNLEITLTFRDRLECIAIRYINLENIYTDYNKIKQEIDKQKIFFEIIN